MKFWTFMKNMCRKEKSLNEKRPNPYVDVDEAENPEAAGELVEVLQDLPNDILDQKVDGLINSVLTGNENLPQDDEAMKLKIASHETHDTETKTEAGSQDEHLEKTGSGSLVKDYNNASGSEEQENFTSEESGDEELEGENPRKKLKTSPLDAAKEEISISQEWDHDLKLIKRNLGRINHLFEVYDGYKRRRTPLKLSSDVIIQESVRNEENDDTNERRTDLTRAGTIKSSVRFMETISSGEKGQKGVSRQIGDTSMISLIETGNFKKPSISDDFVIDLTRHN